MNPTKLPALITAMFLSAAGAITEARAQGLPQLDMASMDATPPAPMPKPRPLSRDLDFPPVFKAGEREMGISAIEYSCFRGTYTFKMEAIDRVFFDTMDRRDRLQLGIGPQQIYVFSVGFSTGELRPERLEYPRIDSNYDLVMVGPLKGDVIVSRDVGHNIWKTTDRHNDNHQFVGDPKVKSIPAALSPIKGKYTPYTRAAWHAHQAAGQLAKSQCALPIEKRTLTKFNLFGFLEHPYPIDDAQAHVQMQNIFHYAGKLFTLAHIPYLKELPAKPGSSPDGQTLDAPNGPGR